VAAQGGRGSRCRSHCHCRRAGWPTSVRSGGSSGWNDEGRRGDAAGGSPGIVRGATRTYCCRSGTGRHRRGAASSSALACGPAAAARPALASSSSSSSSSSNSSVCRARSACPRACARCACGGSEGGAAVVEGSAGGACGCCSSRCACTCACTSRRDLWRRRHPTQPGDGSWSARGGANLCKFCNYSWAGAVSGCCWCRTRHPGRGRGNGSGWACRRPRCCCGGSSCRVPAAAADARCAAAGTVGNCHEVGR